MRSQSNVIHMGQDDDASMGAGLPATCANLYLSVWGVVWQRRLVNMEFLIQEFDPNQRFAWRLAQKRGATTCYRMPKRGGALPLLSPSRTSWATQKAVWGHEPPCAPSKTSTHTRAHTQNGFKFHTGPRLPFGPLGLNWPLGGSRWPQGGPEVAWCGKQAMLAAIWPRKDGRRWVQGNPR